MSNIDGEDVTFVCCHRALIAAPIPFYAPDISCMAVSFFLCATRADSASRCVKSTRTAVYIFPIQPLHHYPLRTFLYTYRVRCLEKYLQGNSRTRVVDRDRERMLRVGRQHPDKHNVDGDEESMETIAPIAKGTIAPSWGLILSIVGEKRCSNYMVSIVMKGWSRSRCSLLLKGSGSHTVVDGISSFDDDVDKRSLL